MTTTIDYDTAKALLQRAVEEKGADYVYERHENRAGLNGCTYARNGEPSCIVGQVFAYAGVPVSTLADMDSAPETYSADGTSVGSLAGDGILSRLGINLLGADTLVLLANVQYSQDVGTTWGVSVERAVMVAERGF